MDLSIHVSVRVSMFVDMIPMELNITSAPHSHAERGVKCRWDLKVKGQGHAETRAKMYFWAHMSSRGFGRKNTRGMSKKILWVKDQDNDMTKYTKCSLGAITPPKCASMRFCQARRLVETVFSIPEILRVKGQGNIHDWIFFCSHNTNKIDSEWTFVKQNCLFAENSQTEHSQV